MKVITFTKEMHTESGKLRVNLLKTRCELRWDKSAYGRAKHDTSIT